MIERVGAAVVAAPSDEDGDNPFAGMDYAKRKAAAEQSLRTSLPGVSGATGEARFKSALKL